MNPIFFYSFFSFFFHLFCHLPGWTENRLLSMEQYLDQVKNSNSGYQGATLMQQGFLDTTQESILPFSPQFFSNLQYTDDRRRTPVPLFQGTQTVTGFSQVGFKKLFHFGLQSQVYYGVTSTALSGVSPQLVPRPNLMTTGLSLQLTQSLWQNGFGKIDRAVRQTVEAQNLSDSYSKAYQVKTLLANAESTYWALAVARSVVSVQKESFDRTIRIRDLNVRRAKSHLIDESDLLTSEAQAKSKQFELKVAIDNERTAARSFNSERGLDSDEVEESLMLPDAIGMQKLDMPMREALRDDVKAAEQSKIVISSNLQVATQKQLPVLNLVGTFSTNGLDPQLSTSVMNTLSSQYPYYILGIQFSLPLDFGTLSSVTLAYAKQMKAAELTYQRRLFDQENEWKDLCKKLNEAKERLSIAIEVEKAQKVKFQRAVIRQKQGVTTAYQVFQFEMDYLTSELNRIQTQGMILNLIAQMKTYQSGQEEKS